MFVEVNYLIQEKQAAAQKQLPTRHQGDVTLMPLIYTEDGLM